MAITVDWKNKIINVPRADMLLIQSSPTEIRQLDIDAFRLTLKDLEDDAEGMTFLDTHRHNTTVTVGGAILARVIEIINGYTVTFEDGQYAVNLVGANSNIGDVTNVNQVSVRSANSAGLQDLNSLQAASFGGGVAINTSASNTGTLFPVGTRQFPVNNVSNCRSILLNRGLKNIFVTANLVLGAEDLSSGFTFRGDNINISLNITDGANIDNCEFNLLSLDGYLDNNNLLRECRINSLVHVSGIIFNCGLVGTLRPASVQPAVILDSFSLSTDGYAAPSIDMSDALGDVIIRGWKGDLLVKNCSNANAGGSFEFDSGIVTFDSTVTAGAFTIRGNAEVVDNSTGSAVVLDKTVNETVPKNTWNRPVSAISVSGSVGEKMRKNLLR